MVTSPVEAFQSQFELDMLVDVFNSTRVNSVLEIGAMYGGTLWEWLAAESTESVTVIDDEMRNADLWQEWAFAAGIDLHLLRGRSQDADVISGAARSGPYDFIFIDADHTYEAVKADWQNFGPMVSPGGLVVFHDILPRPGYGVSEVWAEVKAAEGACTMEICQNEVMPGAEGRCGVGILWT